MKTAKLLFLFFLLTSCTGQTKKKTYQSYETNSNVQIEQYSIENLELLGRIWGFLKYHHPNVGKGNFNWDFELFEILPKYNKATSDTQRDEILLKWIEGLGDFSENEPSNSDAKLIKLKPNLNWVNNYNLSSTLKDKLKYIYKNRHQGKQHYIKMISYVGNPKFINEPTYDNIKYSDSGFHILALFRYWNAINYFYPYKYLTDKKWNTILKEYIPVFLKVKDELGYELAILKLISEINDSHANVVKGGDKISKWYGNYQSTLIVKFIENKLVVTDFYNPDLNTSKLEIGDVILEINNESVDDIVTKLTPYTSASNKPTLLRKIASNILRSSSSSINIKLKRSNGEETVVLNLYKSKELKREEWAKKIMSNTYRIIDENIGYIPAVSVKEGEVKSIMKSFKNTKGIIIDLRYYPNTTDLLYKLVPYLVSSKKQYVKFSKGNVNNPGEFVFSEPLKFSKNKNYYKGKIVVLVNEDSQSLAEYMTMAYQIGHNTTVLGSQTAGADGDVSYLDLPGGIKTVITGIGVYYPNGNETQRIGIKPNITVRSTINDIKNNKDILLDKAIELIKQQ